MAKNKNVTLELDENTARMIAQAINEKITDLGRLVSNLLTQKQNDAVKPVEKSIKALSEIESEIYDQLRGGEE